MQNRVGEEKDREVNLNDSVFKKANSACCVCVSVCNKKRREKNRHFPESREEKGS